jgi:hypothetical protein
MTIKLFSIYDETKWMYMKNVPISSQDCNFNFFSPSQNKSDF